jgi:hypothetical protein
MAARGGSDLFAEQRATRIKDFSGCWKEKLPYIVAAEWAKMAAGGACGRLPRFVH